VRWPQSYSTSFRSIERSQRKYAGYGPAFFSPMIGLFAMIIGACITFAASIWPMIGKTRKASMDVEALAALGIESYLRDTHRHSCIVRTFCARTVSRVDAQPDQLPPAGVALVATLLNVLLAFDPNVVMAAMQTTMMRASITAYSTAVGPSSFFRKLTTLRTIACILDS
jgi:hypothetical protein